MPYLVEPSYKIRSCPTREDVRCVFEPVCRICYQSKGKVVPGSDLRLLKYIIANGHLAMCEFVGDIVVTFVSNRGFSHELVRHRLASFAQESTRYCDYNNEEFNSRISVLPVPDEWMKLDDPIEIIESQQIFEMAYNHAEEAYNELRNLGVPTEIAREVLPIGLKTEVSIKANVTEWRHIFDLRTSKRAHPRMRQLMIPLLLELANMVPIVFSDLADRTRNYGRRLQ